MSHTFILNLKSKLFPLGILLFASISYSQNQSNYNLLWKIEGDNLSKPSYLFGTMHVDDERAFKFSDAVMPAIEQSEVFALEINPDSLYIAMNNKIVEKDPEEVFKSILTDDEYKLLVKRFEEINNYTFEDSEIKDPNTILALLMPETDNENDQATFVDFYLYKQAKTMRKTITGLENMDDQLNYFENLPQESKREYILEHIEDSLEVLNIELEKLKQIYYTGNIHIIDSMINTYDGYDLELTKRNKVMVNSIMKLSKTKSLFSAVGAAHLPGENGIIALLKNEGYKVTPVEATFTGIAETYKVDESKMLWHTFSDDDLGYSLEIPDEPNFTEDFPGFTIYMYNSHYNKTLYLFSGINLTFQPDDADYHKLVNKFITTITESYEGTVLNVDEVNVQKGIKYIAKIDMLDGNIMKLNIRVINKMMYYLGAQTEANEIDTNKSVERFFNSLKTKKPKEVAVSPWTNYHDKIAAYSVNLPGEPEGMTRDYPNPHEPDTDPYIINLKLLSDYKNKDNYLIRYNDHPVGYFMEDIQDGFKEIKANFGTKATFLGEEKTIYLNGYEGREYELLIQDKYHTICRVYYRGNRLYLIMHQKLSETEKVNPDNDFLNSFKFEPYENPETLTKIQPKDSDFEFKFFEKKRIMIDTLDYDDTYLKNSHDYFTKNPKSGGVYQFGYSDMQDYFKIKSKDEFYNLNIEYLLGWNDSIVQQDTIKVANNDALDFYILNKNSNKKTRHRIWIHNKQFFLASAFVSEEELNNHITDSIFNSFKPIKSNSIPFDIYSSKTNLILNDLKSNDSIVFKRAFGALSYYDFEEADLKNLHEALTTTYADSIKNSEIKNQLVNILSNLNNKNTLEVFKTEYLKDNISDDFKTNILVSIPKMDNENALPVYNSLIFNSPPIDEESYHWSTLSPFKDSVAYANKHYHKLIPLTTHSKFRRDIINISSEMIKDSTINNEIVFSKFEELTKYAIPDLLKYLETNESEGSYDYTYSSLMYAYTGLFHLTPDNYKLIDSFTNDIVTKDSNEWLVADAIGVRIKHNLTIEDSIVTQYLENKNHRIDLMSVFHKAQRLSEVSENYLNLKTLAEIKLYNYVSEDDDVEKITYLGTVVKDKKDYYIFSFNHPTEENEQVKDFIGIVGPIYTISQDNPFIVPEAYSGWEDLKEDWKTQGENLIIDLKEYGY